MITDFKNRNAETVWNIPAQKLIPKTTAKIIKLQESKPEILFITSFPNRECGIATYSQDLIGAIRNKFGNSFKISVCAVENGTDEYIYDTQVRFILKADHEESYIKLAQQIDANPQIQLVLLQHEFGFYNKNKEAVLTLLQQIHKPKVLVFHTVLPNPNEKLFTHINAMAAVANSIIVMTNTSSSILNIDYHIPKSKISVIPHGTHLVAHGDKNALKEKYDLKNKTVLATFGLISSGKSIETTLKTLPAIIAKYPDVMFLIIGKTHPTIVKNDGEQYRKMLENLIDELNLSHNVRFVNYFLPLPELLEYLQLTDIYLFTSKDPNQAVSGTFSYALSCGCPIISTPIPHAVEVLKNGSGIIFDFENTDQLEKSILLLLDNEVYRKEISLNALHTIAATAWENAALNHVQLFQKVCNNNLTVKFTVPGINLNHIKRLTTDFGMLQFAKIYEPDRESGYTLDDNARALIAVCKHYELFQENEDLQLIETYLNFIKFCLLNESYFLNYVDINKQFTSQNYSTNLADANGRAIWALGYLLSNAAILPDHIINTGLVLFERAIICIDKIYSTRAMGFIIKGLFYKNNCFPTSDNTALITTLANRYVQMYKHESDENWKWFEGYFTYANSILSEAMLCAYLVTGSSEYKDIARESFDFFLSKIFINGKIKVISNKTWMQKNVDYANHHAGGEQPIDVAYTILALDKFYRVFEDLDYLKKMTIAFNWFHGRNHLNKIIYNPCTGGCYDGLEDHGVNLNQGAESTISYLLARLTMEENGNVLNHTTGKDVFSLNVLAI